MLVVGAIHLFVDVLDASLERCEIFSEILRDWEERERERKGVGFYCKFKKKRKEGKGKRKRNKEEKGLSPLSTHLSPLFPNLAFP